MKKFFSLSLCLVMAIAASAANIADQILAKHKAGESFKANFTEVKVLSKKKEIKREGTLTFKASEYLRMDYTNPEGDYTLIDEGTFNIMQDGKLQKLSVKKEDSKMAVFRKLLLLAMQGKVEDIAKQQGATVNYKETSKEWEATLTDEKAKGSQEVRQLTLTYAKSNGQIIGMVIEMGNGNVTTYKMK